MKLRMMTNRGIKNQTKKYHQEIADLYLSLSLSLFISRTQRKTSTFVKGRILVYSVVFLQKIGKYCRELKKERVRSKGFLFNFVELNCF